MLLFVIIAFMARRRRRRAHKWVANKQKGVNAGQHGLCFEERKTAAKQKHLLITFWNCLNRAGKIYQKKFQIVLPNGKLTNLFQKKKTALLFLPDKKPKLIHHYFSFVQGFMQHIFPKLLCILGLNTFPQLMIFVCCFCLKYFPF